MSRAALSMDELRADLRTHTFALGPRAAAPRRIGAEVELIPVAADTRKPVPIAADGGPCSLDLLRRFGALRCWREEPSSYGVPRFVLPDGGIVSFEPGGQIELSAPACGGVGALVAALRGAVVPLRAMAAEEGIDLLSVGIEPNGAVDDVPQQLPGTRYRRMTEFMRGIGTGGERMMRQTAAFQASLDFGARPLDVWRVLNAAAPVLVAIFANSPVYGGAAMGDRSFRARVWRELDGGRTGVLPCGEHPVEEYLDLALRAPAILLGEGGEWPSFGEWNARGAATLDDWHTHLTTLFPEIRPKGFVEVRSMDAVAPEWYAAPLVLLAGITHDAAALAEAGDVLGAPSAELLRRAGRDGLRDPGLARAAGDLWDVAFRGAARAGERFIPGECIDEARAFAERYTRAALSPADDVDPPPAPAVRHLEAAAIA
ncbi:MAG TPA: glutamate-cysteine ligase family protein [Longimicrobiaceae bacterium]|nr:glutamate-cysteine ligase family protein [Longimicrobiaceae bacterium]